jgi:predicted nucleic acid-binding protein
MGMTDLEEAQTVLRNAAASKNGSTNDAHVLALAWTVDADLWSHDRDFAGTGWPSWSTANLMAALPRL